MKINGPEIVKALKTAGIDQGKAADLAHEFAEAYDNAEKDMVSLKDLDALSARSDARIKAAFHRQRIWIAGIAFLFTIAIVAIVKL